MHLKIKVWYDMLYLCYDIVFNGVTIRNALYDMMYYNCVYIYIYIYIYICVYYISFNDTDLDVTSYKFKLKIIVLKSVSKLFKLPIILW